MEANFIILETYTWYELTTDTIATTAFLKFNPIANSEEGIYILTLVMTLSNYPSAPSFLTTFKVTILNGCPNGDGISSVIVPTFVVQAKDSKVYSFSILTECREAVYNIIES